MQDDTVDKTAEGTANAQSEAYDVGYGKPPKYSQFKPGQSGNPRGRKQGSKTTATLLREILDEKVTVRDGHREKKIPRKEAWLRQTMNNALKGDAKASATIISLLRDVRQIEPEPANPNGDARARLADEDYEIMQRHFPDRMRMEDEK